jgi:diguanylate cyclase (GGDEF)-like protein
MADIPVNSFTSEWYSMKQMITRIFPVIPHAYAKEFQREILKDNYRRLSIITVILFVVELILYFFSVYLLNTGRLILVFLVGDFIMIPVFWILNQRFALMNTYVLKAVQYIYALFILLFGIGLAYATQGYADLVHMYFMMIFGVSFILYLKAAENLILLLLTLAPFLIFLPSYQHSQDIFNVISVNSIIVNMIAWFIARMIMANRIRLFLDRKIIEGKNRELEELVIRDSMTKLYNHETAYAMLQEEIEMSRGKKALSVLIADIDDFKNINDTYGHPAGDAVIKTIANAIAEVVRAGDRVCRYGGEEFMVIMPDTDLKSAFHCAERIRDTLEHKAYAISVLPTISGGISQYDGETIHEFVMKTDRKLYEAKQSGKNRFM